MWEADDRGRADGAKNKGGSPKILLVDCDMFYVQVARLEDPEGAGREDLLIVGGSPTGRGVVTSASYGAREFGVRSGMPTSQALSLCPRAKVVPVSRKACATRSRQVKEALQDLSPVVQAASIDEFYLDLTGTERLLRHEPLEKSATRIRKDVLDRTSISVSVGGGTRKLIAKLAAGLAKPGGVHVVAPGQEESFMRRFELREIPGVGPALARALEKKGLVSVEDLLPVDRSWLERWLGPSRASWLWKRVRGRDSSRVNPAEPRKSVSSERTFGTDLFDDRDLERELLRLSTSLGATLRSKGLRGRTITVKVRDEDFRTRQAGHTLPDAVESDATLYSVAQNLFRELRAKRRVGVRLLGVGISTLVEGDSPPQLDLFGRETLAEPERDRVVSRVLDDLRGRFGDRAILPGSMLEKREKG
ncbi:MAG: DNA polymerase IV [Gemmatimonadetes bacterium]|nr:DNA polymerase IV [Gemmatimonadota bacterium]NNM04002.1 DNA polymerase IV [Gemmatimonadota bacterium]